MLKEAFTQAPILAHFNPDNPIVIKNDTSDYVIAAIFYFILIIAYYLLRQSPMSDITYIALIL